MKTLSTPTRIFIFAALLAYYALFFQSCTPSNDVKPVSATPSYLVTVKVTDLSQEGGTIAPQQTTKHFVVTTTDATPKTLLETDIVGNYTFNYNSPNPNISIKATLTSSTDFVSSIEVDANGKMHAYHGGSCAGTQYEITDNINF